jgi:hypothetical protein
MLPVRTMGSTGRMQGESIVIIPEIKAKARRTIIGIKYEILYVQTRK